MPNYNSNNKWVEFELANVNTYIIRVRFGLMNVDTICTLIRHKHNPLIRIVTPNLNDLLYLKMLSEDGVPFTKWGSFRKRGSVLGILYNGLKTRICHKLGRG